MKKQKLTYIHTLYKITFFRFLSYRVLENLKYASLGKKRMKKLYLVHLCETQKISLEDTLFKNIIYNIQKYTTCCVFLAPRHMMYLCICAFVFLYLHGWLMEISFLISLNNPLFKNIQHVGSFWYFVMCFICVFVYLCVCICVFVY